MTKLTKPKRRIRLEGYPEIQIASKPFIKRKGFNIGRNYVRFGVSTSHDHDHIYIEVDGRILGYFHFHANGEISFMCLQRLRKKFPTVSSEVKSDREIEWIEPDKDGDVMLMLRQLKVKKISGLFDNSITT